MFKVICETSMRHVHLSQSDLETLFGKGAKLEVSRSLSQPNQFLAVQRVDIIGPKRALEGVGIIGPVRKESQIEISRTDAFALGLKDVPIRQSGDTKGAPTVKISANGKEVAAAAIIAKRHVHLTPETAKKQGITDGQIVKIQIEGERAGVLGAVVAR
jgi:putative phosphotransacetylase